MKDMMTEDRQYPVSHIAKNEWKQFALYTVEARAIPNMIDGLKPVQRFYLYSSLVNSRHEFKKVSAVSGVVSDYGYNHGETAAASAGQLMAAEWNNNICLIEGRGSFGTRQVQSAASPRYVYTRIHDNFDKYIKDIELSPKHTDPEHEPPAFYIPVIPLVLVNSIRGIATGFATNILPRDPKDLTKKCEEYITTGNIKSKPKLKFPDFKGKAYYSKEEDKYFCEGLFERKGKTVVVITEIPYGYDRETYIQVLDKIEESGDIIGYEDQCDKSGFKFEVKLKQSNTGWSDEKIKSVFKLVKPFTENLTVIDQNGKLKEYTSELDLIKDFCDYRLTILSKRIKLKQSQLHNDIRWNLIKKQFIQGVLNDKIIFKNNNKQQVSEQILQNTKASEEDVDRLLKLNMYSLTLEQVKELEEKIRSLKQEYEYWSSTTAQDQFLSDIKQLG